MPRDLVLGNGSLLVCLDRNLFVRDLYWPYVGLYNHLSGNAIRFGVWVDGRFSWIDDHWDRSLGYRPYSLVTDCHLSSLNSNSRCPCRMPSIIAPTCSCAVSPRVI